LVLGVLLEYHASVSQQDNNGRTALHYAAAEHTADPTDTSIVQLLVEAYGGDPKGSSLPIPAKGLINIRDGKGRTALHEAQSAGNTDIYNLLVDAAENSSGSDNTGLNGTRKKRPDWRGRWKLWTLT
jgi:ankyrin repeat protein